MCHLPFGNQLRGKLGDEKANTRDRLSSVLSPVSTTLSYPSYERGTHVVGFCDTKIIKHIVGYGIGNVVPIDVQCCKHDAHPNLTESVLFSSCYRHLLTMIFQSTLRRTAFSSRHVHRNWGSNADQFSHCGCMYSSLYCSMSSESQILGCVAICSHVSMLSLGYCFIKPYGI